ncbi:hypothetical protein EDI28_23605 [Photobacterium chitinilyticum]|uniref:ParB protein family C-terminal domain-containing protein n=1 Tax=Photobacterium chitinilyticum TaxID=2485123 RepID=A0A3S3R5Z3_9GAMM|nr:hypothetical protein EDI28_23605 [Photobacterium chitinilyticum]
MDSKGLTAFIKKISVASVNVQPEQSYDEQKDALINAVKCELKIAAAKKDSDKAMDTPIADFETKGVYVRKRVKGRNFSYESGRLPKAMLNELARVIGKHNT